VSQQELHAALGLPQGLQVRHARVDSLRVQVRSLPVPVQRKRAADLCTLPSKLPGLATAKTEPWIVHLGTLDVAIQEVPFGASGAWLLQRGAS
jgi:hypothetical protein